MSGVGTAKGLVTIFGGSGFVGRHLVKRLAAEGWRIRVACRRPNLAGFLRPLGAPGQVVLQQANLRFPHSVEMAVAGSDAIVNLVGILANSGPQTFDALHAKGTRVIAEAAEAERLTNFVQLSAIGANTDSASAYVRTKGEGEMAVREAMPSAAIIRPSLIFGPEDDLFNRFAAMARLLPVLPYVPGTSGLSLPFRSGQDTRAARSGETLFQPVYVGDVAGAIAAALQNQENSGKILELGGPEVLTFQALLEVMLKEIDRKKLMVPLPLGIAGLMASVLQFVPGKPLTPDQVTMLAEHNIVSDAAAVEGRTLAGLGIQPHALDTILPLYLKQYRRAGQFTKPHHEGA